MSGVPLIGTRHHPRKRRIGVFFRLAFAIGCVGLLCGLTLPKAHLHAPDPQPTPVYRFADLRNPKLAKSANESLLITNCAYGAVRIGQRDIDPDISVLLHRVLASRFGERLAGRNVELTAFSVHINNSASLRESAKAMYSGPIAGAMIRKKIGCSEDDTRGGYSSDEVPSGTTPFIVSVHVLLDGVAYHGRSIVSFADMTLGSSNPAHQNMTPRDAMMQRSVDLALTRLGNVMEAGLSSSTGAPVPSVGAEAPVGFDLPKPSP